MNKNTSISIVGAGGHARSIYSWLTDMCEVNNVQFIDSYKKNENEQIFNCDVVCCDWDNIRNINSDTFLLGIGDNQLRKKIYYQLISSNRNVQGVSHPTSVIGIDAKVHQTVYIGPLCIVGPLAEIRENTILNSNCIIEHETIIGNHCHIAPGAKIAGRVTIGNNVFVGIGAVIKENVVIKDNAVIGAGAVVISDVLENDVVAGVPAKSIKKKE